MDVKASMSQSLTSRVRTASWDPSAVVPPTVGDHCEIDVAAGPGLTPPDRAEHDHRRHGIALLFGSEMRDVKRTQLLGRELRNSRLVAKDVDHTGV